jgi:hypothetical protein
MADERKESPLIIEKRMRLFDAINAFCRELGGWVISVPGHRTVRIECRKDSVIPAKLIAAGHDVRHVGSHTRIHAGDFLPVDEIEIVMPGK